MATLLSVLFALAPLVVTAIMELGVRRGVQVLGELPDATRETALWQRAELHLRRRSQVPTQNMRGKRDVGEALAAAAVYWIALALVSLVMLLGWNFALDAPWGAEALVQAAPPYIIGPTKADAAGTVAISSSAFAIAYAVVLFRMYVRLNTNNWSAMETLFDAVHLVSAMVVATVGRLLLQANELPDGIAMALAFIAGVRPNFALDGLFNVAWGALTAKFPALREVKRGAPGTLPPDLPIGCVDGIDDEVADRLARLDVRTCQRLAFGNPVTLWERTPFTLPEIVDWAGQAMLAVLLPGQLAALRQIGVRTVFDLRAGLTSPTASLRTATGMDDTALAALAAAMGRDPQVRDLSELQGSL